MSPSRHPVHRRGAARCTSALAGLGLWAALALVATPTLADQTDPKLDGLFADLRTATDGEVARGLETQIWMIWMRSGDEEVNRLLEAGTLAMQASQYDAALAAFNRVVEKAPGFAEGWNKRATVFYLMGNYPASLADIARTLKLEPRHFGALSGLGLVEVELDKPEQALDAFEKALAIDPHLDEARSNAEQLRQQIQQRQI
ncbi:MAG: tetratricopeptide repeat protein [Dongiaceae bacterium]